MQPGSNIKCTNGLIIAREYSQRYKLYVPASRQGGGDIYLDKDLHELVERGIWEKQSDKMVSYVSADRIDDFLSLVGTKHPGTVPVARQMMASVNVQGQSTHNGRRHYPIKLPAPPGRESIQSRLEDIRLSALALELEMEMEMELELA